MQHMKTRNPSSPLPVFLAGATAISIALAVPAIAQSKPQDSHTAQGTSLLKTKGADSRPLSAKHPTSKDSVNTWDIGWKVIAGLGLLSGMSALLWNWYDFRPRGAKARKRLEGLESSAQTISYFLDGVTNLKNWAQRHEQKVNEVTRIVALESSSQKGLAELRNNMRSLDNELQQLKQQYSRLNVQNYAISSSSPQAPLPALITPSPLPPEPPVFHGDQVKDLYTSAVLSNDRSRIRSITKAELNITQASEDTLTRGTSVVSTELQSVSGGGSYLLVECGGKYWICPTVQTLTSFTTFKPHKGIFEYEEIATVSTAELKKPAEAVETNQGVWQVVSKGIVLVPA